MMVALLLVLAACCGLVHDSRLRRPMWYHPYPENWQNAQDKCRSEHGGDLLTVLSQDELDFMDLSSYYAWIGRVLHIGHAHWGAGKGKKTQKWPLVQGDSCACASYDSKSMQFFDCSHRHFFFCTGSEFVAQAMSWYHAWTHCSLKGKHLITFPSLDLHAVDSPVHQLHEFPVWIGLHSDGVPTDPAPGSCVSMGSVSKSMSVHSCSDAFPFVCSKPNLVLLQELLSWEQAVAQCRKLSSSSSFRLLSVDQSHMDTIKNVLRFAQNNKVWVGLRFLADSWFWTDGAPVALSLPSCPESTHSCGALVVSSSSVEPSDCSEKLNALCHKVS